MLLGEGVIEALPVLDIGKRVGPTNYIDFIGPDEMFNSIMKGVDVYRRPFISIKVKYNDLNSNSDEDLVKFAVGTFFQRYTDDNYNWAYGTRYKQNIIYNSSIVRDYDYESLETRLKKIFDGESVNIIKVYQDDNTNLSIILV